MSVTKQKDVTVPLLDLKIQYASIKKDTDEAIERVVNSQMFILGPEVDTFEKRIAAYLGCNRAIGVSSGTDALLVALTALDVGAGDEVITTPFTFFATVGVILRLGAVPVFVDIDPHTYNIDPDRIETVITPKTKSILPVHLYGQCADMTKILEIAAKHDLPIIEDAAQAIGAKHSGKYAGAIGTMGCFSFFPSKNLGGFGDGGMITTNDESLDEKIRVLRNQGAQPKYYHKYVGGNFRLDALQAAVLSVKLDHLDTWSAKRRANAEYYSPRLTELQLTGTKITPPRLSPDHVLNQYVIRAERRDELQAFLREHNVGTEIYYPIPIHLQECVRDGRYRAGDFPESERAAESVLALPIYAELTESQLDHVILTIKEFYDRED